MLQSHPCCRLILLGAAIALFFLPLSPVFAHYPFPCTKEEKEKANRISKAVEKADQDAVNDLSELVGDENPRVGTAAIVGIMRLADKKLELKQALDIVKSQCGAKQPYLKAAAEMGAIMLDAATAAEAKRSHLLKVIREDKEWLRRMALEALWNIADASCLPELEALVNDGFGVHDDQYDMKATARVAFEVWWKITEQQTPKEKRLTVLAQSLRLAKPFVSPWAGAACEMLKKDAEHARPVLVELFSGTEYNSKAYAFRTLKDIATPEVCERLREIAVKDLNVKEQDVRHLAISVFVQFPDKKHLDLLSDIAAKDSDHQVRQLALCAIGGIKDKAVQEILKTNLKNDALVARTRAAALLAERGGSEGDEILLNSLEVDDPDARWIGIYGLRFVHDQDKVRKRLVEILSQRQKDEDAPLSIEIERRPLREVILRALSSWPIELLRPLTGTLQTLLTDDNPRIRYLAQEVIRALERR